MKRHYTTTDLTMLRLLIEPGAVSSNELFDAYLGMRADRCWPSSSLATIHNSLQRLSTDRLVELWYVGDALRVRRLGWPASLSRILAA